MNDSSSQVSGKRWYVAKWPPLAWLETAIKLVALVIGILALVDALSTGQFELPDELRLAQFVVLLLLSLGLVAAIFDRFAEREAVAMIFVIVNNFGHWGMVVALASEPFSGSRLVAFTTLMLIGDLVKLAFLKKHDFQVRDVPRAALYGLTALYVVGYAIILMLELFR